MTLCEKLTQARKAAGLTQADVAAKLNQPIGQSRLAVVDVGDDREISDQGCIGHARLLPLAVNLGKSGFF